MDYWLKWVHFQDGFAIPSTRGAPSPDRPPRPPTVDLTKVPDQSPRTGQLQCKHCPKTFLTEASLAEHAKAHQKLLQTGMPYKCHLCNSGFQNSKNLHSHYQQYHQLHLSAGDMGIPVVDFRNPTNVQHMARMGITQFLPLTNFQNRGQGGVVGIPLLTIETLQNANMNIQQWGVSNILTLGPPKSIGMTQRPKPYNPRMQRPS